MSKEFLLANDTINGAEAEALITIDGRVYKLLSAKSVEATMEKRKAEIRVVGARSTQQKAAGWSGKGSISQYYVSSHLRRLAIDYIKTGRDFYFDMVLTNNDAQSGFGSQSVALHRCNFDKITLAKLDAEKDALDETLDFTFEDADLLEPFSNSNL